MDDNIDIESLLKDLKQKKEQIKSNDLKMHELKQESSRIIADMISTVNGNRESIVGMIAQNECYLKLIPNFPYPEIKQIIDDTSKSGLCKDDADKIELLMDTLNEINLHTEHKDERCYKKTSKTKLQGFFDYLKEGK